MVSPTEVGPVVEACPFEFTIRNLEAEFAYEMQMAIGANASPSDVTGVVGNFGLKKCDVKKRRWITIQDT